MKNRLSELPDFIQKLVPQPNFDYPNFNNLTKDDPKTIINSVKTQTVLNLLNPIKIYETTISLISKPIVLVFCQPSEELTIQRDKIYPYTPVSYASWLEAAGAICMPIPYNLNEGSIQFLLQRSNGLLIPGGGSNLYKNFEQKQGQGPVMIGFCKIFRFIQKLWNKGIHYPIWGTCLGLQIMLLAISGDIKILSHLNSRGHQTQIYSHYDNSDILSKMPIKLRLKMENCKLLNFQHTYGISIKKFIGNQKLNQKLKIVQISKDKDGKWFCSGLEGKQNPIFLSQYHPQKQAYQWSKTGQIKHNKDSIQLSQYLVSAFLDQCKKCKPIKQFSSLNQLSIHCIQQYKQIHTPLKMYKVYAIDYKYRNHDKQIRKQLKNQRSSSIVNKIKPIL